MLHKNWNSWNQGHFDDVEPMTWHELCLPHQNFRLFGTILKVQQPKWNILDYKEDSETKCKVEDQLCTLT